MKLTLTGKAVLIVWLLMLIAIALFPPRKFTLAGNYGSMPDTNDLPWVYLCRSPERLEDVGRSMVGSTNFYQATDWDRTLDLDNPDRPQSGTLRAAEIDLGRLLGEWMIVSCAVGIVWIALPARWCRRPEDLA